MDDQLQLYENFFLALEQIADDNTLATAERQLSQIEDAHPELLKGAAPWMVHLPEDPSATFTVCILGSDGHALAHTIDLIYKNALIYWIANINLYDDTLDGRMDYVILSDRVGQRMLTDDRALTLWCSRALNETGRILWKSPFGQTEIGDLYNFCNFRGFAVETLDSNDLAIIRRVALPMHENNRKQRWNRIYVVCPASRKTGGPELLHQLVYHLNCLSGNAAIAYINTQPHAAFCHPEYADYVAGHIVRYEDIEDTEDHAVVIPEGWNKAVLEIRHATMLFWWLSVDNFLATWDSREQIAVMLEQIRCRVHLHLVQSAYARDYLLKNGVQEEMIRPLGDYINREYLSHREEALHAEREDLVVYNPVKGAEYVRALIDRAPDIHWRAIENMTTAEVGALLRRAKIYIDFGNHPGKDRIPREAAMSGCIVITGRRGAAAFHEDVPIPEQYKLSETENTLDDVLRTIRESLARYDSAVRDFDDYRDGIAAEEQTFLRDVTEIFFTENPERQ